MILAIIDRENSDNTILYEYFTQFYESGGYFMVAIGGSTHMYDIDKYTFVITKEV